MTLFNVKMSDYSTEVKSRYIAPFCYILAVVALANTYIYAVKFKSNSLAIYCFLSACAALLVPLFKKYFKSHILVANYVVLVFLICVTSLTLYTGGIFSNPIWWLGTIPLTATFLMNAFFGVVWFIIILINFIVIQYLGHHGLLPPNVLLNVPLEGRLVVSFVFNASLISVLCVLADLIRDGAFLQKEEFKLKAFQLNQLASLGKLASGVAHEINNPLTVLRGTQLKIARMIMDEQEIDRAVLAEYMAKIQKNISRIQDVTGLMRAISEKSTDRTILKVHLQKLLSDVVQMLSEEIKKAEISIEISYPKNEIYFSGIYTEIFQAFFNIIENAIFELQEGPKGDRKIIIRLESDAQKIFVLIQDNGGGISPEIRDHIFDPFFTTKNFGIGKGLGLSFSFNVFVNNGGSLELLDTAMGSTFKVTLPKI
jgi:two-component system NtrC family sensor kinase